MKKCFYLVAVLFAAITTITFTSCGNFKSDAKLTNDIDSISYAQGMLVGSNIAPQLAYDNKMNVDEFIKGFKSGLMSDSTEYSYRIGQNIGSGIAMNMERDVNVIGVMMNKDVFLKAFADAINGDSLKFTQTDANIIANTILEKLLAQKRSEEEARFAATPEAQENLAKGEAWLASKAQEEGVIKTESGLLYKVINKGNGEFPTRDSKITMNYRGTLIDGTEFDKSEGAKGVVSGFIPGFTEALLLMDEGAKYEVYIPANLGYGALVQGGIPSNSTLIFELELTDIE